MKRLSCLGLLAAALTAAACAHDAAPATPSTTTTTTTTTPTTTTPTATCAYALSATTASVGPAGGATSVAVTTTSGCAWTATTSASFVTILSGSSGTGTGTVVLNVAAATGANRTATATIAGQTLTISQTGAGLVPSFNMFDPNSQADATTTCRFRGASSSTLSTCQLASTSFTLGPNAIIWYNWSVRYTYGSSVKVLTQSSTNPNYVIADLCGLSGSSATGTVIPLAAQLTIIDSNGNQATATSGSGSQPALQILAFSCGS